MSSTFDSTSDAVATVATARIALIVDAPAPGEANMGRDLALLEACARGEIIGAVRLYGFTPPCLSLGRMQPMSDVDLEACARDGTPYNLELEMITATKRRIWVRTVGQADIRDGRPQRVFGAMQDITVAKKNTPAASSL